MIDVDDTQGAVAGGGQYDIKTDPDTEYILALALGLRYLLGKNWEAEIAGRYSYHIADWKVTDRISGKVSSIDDYTTNGFYLGVGFRF